MFFTQIRFCIKVIYSGEIWRANFSYLKSCSWLGNIISSEWYKDKLFVNYSLTFKMQGMNPMNLSDPWANSPEIVDFHPLKILQEIIKLVLSTPWSNSIEIIDLQSVKNTDKD